MNLNRAYSLVLLLYPKEFRQTFAAPMLAAYQEAAKSTHNSRPASLRFAVAELKGLLAGAAVEWTVRFSYRLSHSGEYTSAEGCLANPVLMLPAGVSRRYESTAGAAMSGDAGLVDEEGFCPNVRQLYAIASPTRRLAISICQGFVPVYHQLVAHRRS
jgi:hypothetical protein